MLGRQPGESFCEILVFVLILRSSLLLTQSGHLSAHVELSPHLAHSVLGLWTKRLYSHFCIYFSLERHAPNLSVTAAVGILKHTCARPRAASAIRNRFRMRRLLCSIAAIRCRPRQA